MILPPGNILQNLYLKERVKVNNWKSFLEIGSGNGYMSRVLLDLGLKGAGCDLNSGACENNLRLNSSFVEQGKYKVQHGDFVEFRSAEKFDLVFASMVIEHIDNEALDRFIEKVKTHLNPNGTILFLVPSSKEHWGIEDEIAGHFLRYEKEDFEALSKRHQLKIKHIAGLTFPMSNWLFSLSNMLIKRSESEMLNKSQEEKTVYTGNRNVPYKTSFPSWLGIVLNETIMYPLHLLQKRFVNNSKALVLYAELI